jgi:multiple sugar transport system ATP-binding protein
VIYVTHDQVEAMTLADKIVVLRDGRVEQAGRPLELYARPANLFVAGFIGSPKMNLLDAVTVSQRDGTLSLKLQGGARVETLCPQSLPDGTAVTLGIRPEHLRITDAGQGGMDGEVLVAERLGGETYFHIRVADKSIIAKVNGDSAIGLGAMVGLQFDPEQAHLFLANGQRA